MDTQVPKKIKDFLLRVETVNNFSYGPRFLKRKDYIIDLGKRLKVFRSNFGRIFPKFMTMGYLLILIVICFPLKAF